MDSERGGSSPSRSVDGVADLARLSSLFDEHRARLRAILARRIGPIVRPRLDADDVLQAAFLRAADRYQAIDEAARRGPAAAFGALYREAYKAYIDAYRRETRERRDARADEPWPEASSIQVANGLFGSLTSASRALSRQELADRIHAALGQLRPDDRRILALRHFDELTHPEAAEALGITPDAAMQRYVRALRRLRTVWNAMDASRGSEP